MGYKEEYQAFNDTKRVHQKEHLRMKLQVSRLLLKTNGIQFFVNRLLSQVTSGIAAPNKFLKDEMQTNLAASNSRRVLRDVANEMPRKFDDRNNLITLQNFVGPGFILNKIEGDKQDAASMKGQTRSISDF